jgi:hypothetical protein
MAKKFGRAVQFVDLAHSVYKGGLWVCSWLCKKFAIVTCWCANPVVGVVVGVAAVVMAGVTVATA